MLTIAERHRIILSKLNENGEVNVKDLSNEFNVSVVTIRKDLKLLEERNLLFRSHGKALPGNPYTTESHVNIKEKINANKKRLIGIEAARRLTDHDSIILASGTSIIEFSRHIKAIEGLTVLSASLDATLILSKQPDIEIIQLGGTLRRSSSSVIGSMSEEMLREFNFTKLFIGVDGIDFEFGLSTTNSMEASLNKSMINAAQKIIVLADSSKFGKKGFGKICGLEKVDEIITDSEADQEKVESLREMGIKVTIT
jgi:DeoR family transcriptional regulator of aga operon